MKRKLGFLAVLLAALCLLAAGCAKQQEAGADSDLVGAYSDERDVTAEDIAVFESAMADLVGVEYQPVAVSTQVVAGMNYRFYAKATTVTAEPREYYAYVDIFVPPGEDAVPELVEITEIENWV